MEISGKLADTNKILEGYGRGPHASLARESLFFFEKFVS